MKKQIEHLTTASEALDEALFHLRDANNGSSAVISTILNGLIRDCAKLHNDVLLLRSDIKHDAGII